MAFVRKSKKNIIEEFNRGKSTVTYVIEDKKKDFTRGFDKVPQKRQRARSTTSHYDKYKHKYDNGDLDKFNSRDILYFFKDLAEEHGNNYVIPNMQTEMAKIKNVMNKGYTPTQMVTMIDFLFTSGQTYLEIKKLSPGILCTGWCNKIFNDSQDWLEDNFDPNASTKKVSSKRNQRLTKEWSDDEEDEW